jgi:Family of unknown function (DUF6502)
MKKKSAGLETSTEVSFRALRKIFRPIVKYMIARGITFPAVTQLLKSLYVDVANEEFPLLDRRATDSRVSMLTGIHRGEVKRLTEESTTESDGVPASVSLGAQVVARWISDPRYLDANANPLPLPRHASDGGEISFESLVATIRRDIRSRPMLDEWLRLGVVHLDDQDRVCLETKAFVPHKDSEEKAFYFGQNLHDHIAVSVSNMLGEQDSLLERSVYYHRLTPASVETLKKLATELGMRSVQEVNRLAAELDRLDNGRPDANERMNFGLYFYRGPSHGAAARPATNTETKPARRTTKGKD